MKYLLLKHYRGGPTPTVDFPPMDRWRPEEVDAHIQFMRDFAAGLGRAASTSTSRRWHPTARSCASTAKAARRWSTARSPRRRTSSRAG